MFDGRTAEAVFAIAERNQETAKGHVYFIQGDAGGPIKIGYTSGRSAQWADRRLADLQAGSPVKLNLRAVVRGDFALERALHHIFKADRLHGEWFFASDELLVVVTAFEEDAETVLQWAEEETLSSIEIAEGPWW